MIIIILIMTLFKEKAQLDKSNLPWGPLSTGTNIYLKKHEERIQCYSPAVSAWPPHTGWCLVPSSLSWVPPGSGRLVSYHSPTTGSSDWLRLEVTLAQQTLPLAPGLRTLGVLNLQQHDQSSKFCAASWQNQQNGMCAKQTQISLGIHPDQPGHPPSLIRVFAVRIKKVWVLSYPLSAKRRLIRLGGCPDWSESLLGVQSFCWFCHVAAPIHTYLVGSSILER